MRRRSVVIIVLLAALLVTPAAALAAPLQHGWNCHPVRFGETVFSIGRLYGVSPWAIASANGLANWDYVRAGDCLVIPWHAGWDGAWHGGWWHGGWCSGGYVVQPGDTLYRIARWSGANPWSIGAANGIYNLNYIQAGDCLRLP